MAADETDAVRPVAESAPVAAPAPVAARRWRRWLLRAAIAGVVLFGLIQLVPYGRDHTNPPVAAGPDWPTASSERLARAACYDCHSNETEWRWYSNVAPVSWLVQRDVDEGRDAVNFSEWTSSGGGAGDEADELHEAVENGSMPPRQYTLSQAGARLSSAERAELVEALRAVEDQIEGGSGRGRGRGRSGGDD